MATIRQLKSGNWNVQIRVKGQPVKTKTFSSHRTAQLWADEQEILIKTSSQPTIYQLGLKYRESVLKGRGSYSNSIHKLNTLNKYFSQPASTITPEQVNDFKHTRLSYVKPDTVIADIALMSRIFKWANDEFIITCENPTKKIKYPRAAKPRNRVIEKHELLDLMSHTSPAMATIFELAYETSMRRSEILSLRVYDLHLSDRLLSVINGKQGDRLVPLTKRAVTILRAISSKLKGNDKLFNLKPNSVTQAFRRARQSIGLDDDVRLHQLRHTRCTIVARKGFNMAQIMAVTGHTDVRSVQRYTHLSAKDVVDLL
ncbi:site-specific integrase [Thalassotalea sp. Y01]|uniref:tyrosine-type recombinase/integrase n=1 Tax=Thalassotalea sp. Y01 TaxID=2729613 RepID=UPI00145E6AA1|nr:site-specific integrase [Thalassotalea sp. Y01]NMP17518.1 site-specific integrase [Thalassotalea sp. Y01]